MAMYRYFSNVDKLPKRPDPTGFLSTKVPSSSIVLANAGAKSMLDESVMWVWLTYTQYGRGFAIVEPRNFFREIVASGQFTKILSRENFSTYGSPQHWFITQDKENDTLAI